MTVKVVTLQLLSVVKQRPNISLETVSQKADVRAPLEVSGQVSQRHSKSSKHHAGNSKNWTDERSVLWMWRKEKKKNLMTSIIAINPQCCCCCWRHSTTSEACNVVKRSVVTSSFIHKAKSPINFFPRSHNLQSLLLKTLKNVSTQTMILVTFFPPKIRTTNLTTFIGETANLKVNQTNGNWNS